MMKFIAPALVTLFLIGPIGSACGQKQDKTPQPQTSKPKLAELSILGEMISVDGFWEPDNPTNQNEVVPAAVHIECFRHGGKEANLVKTEAFCVVATATRASCHTECYFAGVPRPQSARTSSKLVWPESHDYKKGKRRFKSDLIPGNILIARYFVAERKAIEAIEQELVEIEQQLDEQKEEQGGEEGLLAEVIQGEGDKQKIIAKALKDRLKEIGKDPEFADERKTLEDYTALLEKQADAKSRLKAAQEDLDTKMDAKYPKLTEDEIKTLVVDDKWLATLAAAVQGELDRVSQTLSGRIRQLAERYAIPLPQLTDKVAMLATSVDEHLKKMGAVWK